MKNLNHREEEEMNRKEFEDIMRKGKEFCEQCKEESITPKIRWDLEFPLVLCDNCYNGFKTHSIPETIPETNPIPEKEIKRTKRNRRIEHE